MIKPHGGKLVNRYVSKPRGRMSVLPKVVLSQVAVSDLYNIAEGVFSPLTGFMKRAEFLSVVNHNKVKGLTWTIPILLDVDKTTALMVKKNKKTALVDRRGRLLGQMKVNDIYRHNKDLHALGVFGTKDHHHPGVRFVYQMKDYLLGGEVYVFPNHNKVANYLSPSQTRKIFEERGYETIAGFQTRNVIHRAHEYLQRCALELVDGLFIQPIVGWKKQGDFQAKVVIKAYQKFIKDYYSSKRITFGTLKTAMRYAGPKEAVFHAIIRKNFGCTHFIVGRDHAGVGGYYGKYEAHDIFNKIDDIGIKVLKFKEPLYCRRCQLIVTEKTCGHNTKYLQEISGTLVRKIIRAGRQPKNQIFRPEVYKLLGKEFKAHHLFY